jgi:dienelactone hydrolase
MVCKDCFNGSVHTSSHTPAGTVTTLHNLPCYIAAPTSSSPPKGIIIFIPDVFGWELINNRLLADSYASAGYKVLLPDFHNGGAIAGEMMDVMETMMDSKASILTRVPAGLKVIYHAAPFMIGNRYAVAAPKVYGFIRDVREASANAGLKIGAAGFCWGGYYTTKLCSGEEKTSDGRTLIDCGYTAHPSQLDVPGDIEKVVLPYSIANGSEDIQLTQEKMKIVSEIFERKRKEGIDVELVEYQGAKHGFAVRANVEVEERKKHLEDARNQAVAFFDKHLAGGQ